jgi:hypothetical protein
VSTAEGLGGLEQLTLLRGVVFGSSVALIDFDWNMDQLDEQLENGHSKSGVAGSLNS